MRNTEEGVVFSEALRALADDTSRERIAISDLLAALGDRAIGALMFIFAVPNVLPTPPGTSTVLGPPLIFLAAQLAFGRKPWLPKFITKRSLARTDFLALINRIVPWLERAEKLLRPRATFLASPPMEYVVGLMCLVLAVVLALPIPLGNMLPALGIAMLALGILERDGYWVAAGLAVGAGALVFVSGVVFAMIKAGLFLLTQMLA
ncbi:exopolysaccharide biosynthesis protein [Lacisediminimonas sp.]|uniref:exopolysaccharide biosynthesis protein n=1 Tax=Lacisediminimonas sp. TaxID=3060582 RepID=UPI00271E06A9|nr:exopolysaccharide biosynthesis protein [Lacisediminimonas sp.]MDO8300688.1 exopolysaccharide biosynthesis protein [Lacisediminimonas sp.]